MVYIPVTWQDWWRKRKKEQDPHYQMRHFKTTGLQQPTAQNSVGHEHANLVTDPMGQWSASLESFHSWQVSSGFDILKSGNGIETASDAQNVTLAQNEPTPSMAAQVADPPSTPVPTAQPLRRRDPYNCPFSTIPGASGPMGPPKMPGR